MLGSKRLLVLSRNGVRTKAQFWSFDLVFAVIIFVFALVLLTYVWVNISGEYSISYGRNVASLQLQLNSLGSQLLSTGTPPNWNYLVNLSAASAWQNITIGLGNGTSGSLSQFKINALQNMSSANYQDVKPALGVGYDYYITITGEGISESIGKNPAQLNSTSSQSMSVPVVIGGSPAQMSIELWTNSTLGLE